MADENLRGGLKAEIDVSPRGSESGHLGAVASHIADEPIAGAISPIVLAGFVPLVEFTAISLLGTAIYLAYVVPDSGFAAYYPLTILGLSAIAVLAFHSIDIYQVQAFRAVVLQFSRMFAAWTSIFMIVFAIVFFARLDGVFSRVWIATWYSLGAVMLFGLRVGLAGLVRTWTHQGRLVRRTAIVGGGEAGASLIQSLEAQADCDLDIIGVFDDRGDGRSPERIAGKVKLGTVTDLVEFARRTRIDLVIFSLPVTAEARILAMLKKLWVLPVDIRLSAHAAQLRFRPRAYSYIGNVPTINVFDRPLADWDVVMKWLFDRVIGSLTLIALSPVLLAVAIAVKLDSRGPVLFRQKRYGFNNELIEVFKFRSMYVDQCDVAASSLVTKGDPRVTRVGRFIRKASLDELPQLFNVVFAGNLSLVGPRPHAMQAKAENRLYDEAVDGYFARHRVKPGITGWAQINGWRGETDTAEKIQRRVEHDLYYIENWSVMFDLLILLKTPLALLKSENAY
ncbi:undecaprenyl-phosphate glucose phosphotransferase [Blastochloris viridis]|uniref:Probable glycosyl transferase n=1 Tax=Blastochloris viridis TaxID=1079 RepID=A0A0H5BFR3_BLAVI|nr:undecaprenyl-phosphate glucose phosphotransferase [Blastochloris viridis]ALK09081.1 UDP-glucose:undecaprenyl-phosphate glucose-1-phosphate transferase [Blastochloris viridis]BAS01056.1 probable glycosyl transferase [Blastochloris viridis]CUU41744.1 Putative colanic biosynthesis UDP-glucose lipid carrier transferase [Blastochloris viridis]